MAHDPANKFIGDAFERLRVSKRLQSIGQSGMRLTYWRITVWRNLGKSHGSTLT